MDSFSRVHVTTDYILIKYVDKSVCVGYMVNIWYKQSRSVNCWRPCAKFLHAPPKGEGNIFLNTYLKFNLFKVTLSCFHIS